MRSIVTILLFWCFLLADGQSVLPRELEPMSYSGSLAGYLKLLTEQTGVHFSYKSNVINKKSIVITPQCSTFSQALQAIKQQSTLNHTLVNSTAVTLYPAKGRYIVGTVFDISSSERVVNAVVQIANVEGSVTTNTDGNFTLFCLLDTATIIVYHPNFQLLAVKTVLRDNAQFFLNLRPIDTLREVNVMNIDLKKLNVLAFDEVKLSRQHLVAVGGESDALAHIKLIAGVQNVSFGQQGLSVRGGSPDQNFTLLDGIPIYNTYHLMGLFSIFNATSINSIKLHKDAFPAKYTNRLSSVIDVSLKNGNKREHEVEMDAGILSSGLYINGPILKDKLSFSVSVRRTYADLLTLPLQRAVTPNDKTQLWAYDLTGKIHWQPNERNSLSVSGYNGGDQLNFTTKLTLKEQSDGVERTEGSLGWRNAVMGAKWNSRISSRIELHTDISVSSYRLRFSDEYSLSNDKNAVFTSSIYANGLQEMRAGIDADIQWSKNNNLNIGAGVVQYQFMPFERGYRNFTAASTTDTNLISREVFSQEWFAFLENKTYYKEGSLTFGLRLSSFLAQQTNYIRIQPKLHLLHTVNDRQQLRFSCLVSNQFVHLVPNNNLGLPIDIWLPVTENIKPMGMTQFSTKHIIKQNHWELQTGIFSKYYTNILEHESGVQLLSGANWEENLKVGTGHSYGLEIAAKIAQRNWDFYSSYTFSRAKRYAPDINENAVYFSKFDRPHIINLLAEYRFHKKIKLIATWSYASGNPITIPVARYITMVGGEDVVVEEYGDINNYRLPSTHHLDIAFVKERQHRNFYSTLTFGVYNVYNRLNPFMAFIGLDENSDPQLKLRSYLPILPTLKYSIKL